MWTRQGTVSCQPLSILHLSYLSPSLTDSGCFPPYNAYLVEGYCPAGLPMYFVAFDGQDDPLRGRALPEHEAVPEFLGFLLNRRPLHFPLICWLSEGLDPQ